MRHPLHLTGSRRGLAATAATVVLALCGLSLIVVALTHQQHAPEPPLSVAPPVSAASAPSPAPSPAASSPVKAKPAALVLKSSLPTALAIPAIGVQSALLSLGQSADGTLDVPTAGPDYNRAGWYRYSPTPGALGPAVIAGHVDSAADGPSVFYRLGGLHVGDKVLVTRADGSVAVFSIDDVRRFSKTAFPTAYVYGNTDHAALRLITCGGTFDRASGHYLDNVVVRASLVSATGVSSQK